MSKHLRFDSRAIFRNFGGQKTTRQYQDRQTIYSPGDAADAIFQIRNGNVKLVVASPRGKQAVISIPGPGDVFGEGCLATKSLRKSTATAIQAPTIACVKKAALARLIHSNAAFARLFITFLLARMVRTEEDFVDRLFNFSEKRLARILLMLSQGDKHDQTQTQFPPFNQEQPAQMVGTTRSRVSHFMNRFRKLGLIDYRSNGPLTIHRHLLSAILNNPPALPLPAVPLPANPQAVLLEMVGANQSIRMRLLGTCTP